MESLQIWSFIAWYFLACTEASSMYGEILSPNYPQAYPNNALESWEINVPPGYGIHLYFSHLDIEPSQNCEYDFVKIMSGSHVEGQLCGQKTKHYRGSHILEEFHIPYNTLTITFQSDFSNEERFTGFAAYYTAVDMNECTDFVEEPCSHYCNNYIGGYFCSCPAEYFLHEDQKTCGVNCSGNVFTELSGEITSPNYPEAYPENSHCDYRVALEPGYRVVLTIRKEDFDLEPASLEGKCSDDLRISAGNKHFGPYCGSMFTGPPEIKTRSNIVDIIFHTDNAVQGKGWKLRYFGDPMPCPTTVIPNSVLDPIRDGYVFKDSVLVTCIEGHEVVMPKGNLLSFRSRCQSDGKWSNSDRRCVPVDCGMPDHLENGAVVYLTESEETHYQATIRYECREPYYTLNSNGNGIYRCSANGKWVDEEEKTELPVCIPVCGVPHTPLEETGRIFGGVFAKSGNFPWQIYFYSPRGGGALISDRWIVTAAHVLDGNPNPTVYAGLLLVGPNALREASPLEVDDVFIHPNWTTATEHRTNFDNDIALLRLKKPVTLGPTISPVCLPGTSSDYDPQIGTLGFVAGWGKTEIKRASVKLKAAKIPVQEMNVCRRVKPDPPADMLTYVFTDNMICAGDGQQDSCQGDSGGAYVIQDPHNETRYYVAGLVSWGPKCGTYGLYTKVANYVDWIVETMNQKREPEE
ncbi:complement C1s subcomponent [Anolis carolinensis]|uniref:Complement C1s n=1 Tax=Anolis carolinensis TaxID=28377 RepID=L7MZR9_ANOCA|nr:PREDICTED: complement C1s subcomponent [Anolis carolinensis]|eukprot:XP_003223793.2 PREDICTED: complement C1s subcomponent [Anolis carolinensis]